MIRAVPIDGPFAAAVVSSATATDVFLAYIQHVLAPELRSGDVVVMDNLARHEHPMVRTLIESAGATPLY